MSRVTRVARTAQLEGIRYWPLYSVQRDRCDKLRANMHFCSDPGACLSCSLICSTRIEQDTFSDTFWLA